MSDNSTHDHNANNIILNALEHHYFDLTDREDIGKDKGQSSYIDALEILIRACKEAAKKAAADAVQSPS